MCFKFTGISVDGIFLGNIKNTCFAPMQLFYVVSALFIVLFVALLYLMPLAVMVKSSDARIRLVLIMHASQLKSVLLRIKGCCDTVVAADIQKSPM